MLSSELGRSKNTTRDTLTDCFQESLSHAPWRSPAVAHSLVQSPKHPVQLEGTGVSMNPSTNPSIALKPYWPVPGFWVETDTSATSARLNPISLAQKNSFFFTKEKSQLVLTSPV